MEELRNLLNEKYPGIDFDTEKELVDNGVLDSVEIVSLISDIEDTFDITVTMEYIQPKYFQSVESMWEMIEELQ
ncbi:MAG: phosphopantetheine-binding protein [Clostridia bacterium]|nr:phosphopantetheine-binding protein [Clostridia bacterium]